MSSIRSKVESILSRYHTEDALFWLTSDYDGVDGDGPETLLYDLYVWDKSYVYSYHYENWFHEGDDKLEFFSTKVEPDEVFFEEIPKEHFTKNTTHIYN